MNKKAVVVLAEGFEEVEAITSIDLLRRAGVEVVTAGVGSGTITASRKTRVLTDTLIENIDFIPDALVLPGGMPGAENLAASEKVKSLIRSTNAAGKVVAAICASPAIVLAPSGMLNGKKATCYPGMEENFTSDITYTEDPVVQDKNIITGRGVGTALDFSLKIIEALVGPDVADNIAKAVLYK